ncbi:frataxin domain-containing protein [uncultured Arthrobacter sp.]|uniref:frataxin domain-containing protein n=1 Tax=uncultured Arthrobacter sp. TaxID=114050 RepID=UPI00321797E3
MYGLPVASGAEIDYENAAGILTLEFEDGSKIIINRQGPTQEIWVAANGPRMTRSCSMRQLPADKPKRSIVARKRSTGHPASTKQPRKMSPEMPEGMSR